jgi:hypothetical protein
LPSARFMYNFSKFKSLSITYNTSTNQPSVSQLQPVPDVTNPLNIREGNPDLRQEYNHRIQANLNLISPFSNKNLFLFFTFQATQNKITNDDRLNNFGIKTTRPVNVNGVYNINSSISYSLPIRWLKGSIELSSDWGVNRTKQFFNQVQNNIRTINLGPTVRVDMNPHEKISLSFGAGINHNRTTYSIQSALNNNYLSQDYNASADWQLPKKFFFATDFTYTVNSQRAAGFNVKIPIWNASISKQVGKYNRGEIKFSGRDLLNRNVGITRNTNNNYIEDSKVLTLRRFFLLSFTYSLSKTGLNNSGGGMMRVITR